MADIDADILALAGDSDEEQNHGHSPDSAAELASRESPRRGSLNGDGPSNGFGRGKQRLSKAGTNQGHSTKKARPQRDDSEEEGEASSSRSSLRSASISQDSSNQEPIDSATGQSRFPIEGKFTSYEDKAEIERLPEVKREEILADRATIVERERQSKVLLQILKSKQREDKKMEEKMMMKKRKAGAADLEEKRKSTRQKTTLGGGKVGEISKPLEEYKRQREQRGVYNEQRKRDEEVRAKDRRRDDRPEDDETAEAEGESESYEWDDGKARAGDQPSKSLGVREELPAILKDYQRATVGRTGFAKVCFYPGFEQAVTGCIVRISIGQDERGENIYRMAQVKKITEGRPYALEAANGKKFVTNQYALAKHGKAEREWPFIMFSDSKVTEAEYERYRKTCQAESVPNPNLAFLHQKVADLNALLNRKWTEEEIQTKLRRSGVLAAKSAPLQRMDILRRRQLALDAGSEADIAGCDAELAALEGPKLAFGTSLSTAPKPGVKKGPSQQDRLAELNKANRRANTEDIRRAQLAEKAREREKEEAIARGEAVANPFARVKTRAKVMHDVNSQVIKTKTAQEIEEEHRVDRKKEGTPLSGMGTPILGGIQAGAALQGLMRLNEEKERKLGGGLPVIRRRLMDDEIIGAMDLGIDDLDL